jgi:FHA domain
MSKLLLKFEDSLLQEKAVGTNEVGIGRSPDNGLVIDNPAVSHYHARVFKEDGRLMLQDFGSMNGTFVNGQRVKMVTLKPGDTVSIGKHTILVAESHITDGPGAGPGLIAAAPKINETVMLDTKERRKFLHDVAAEGESSQIAPLRLKVPTLVVLSGKTDQREYLLTDKLIVIGKSAMATIKLRGWFAPKVAAQINRRDDNSYYIGAADKVPSVNRKPIARPVKLSAGDVVEVAGVRLEFLFRD